MNTFGKIVIKDLEKSEQLPTYGYPIVMEKYSIFSELLDVDRYPLRNYITRRRALLFKFACGLYSLALVRNSTNLAENIPKKFFRCDDDSATLWQAMMAYTVSTFHFGPPIRIHSTNPKFSPQTCSLFVVFVNPTFVHYSHVHPKFVHSSFPLLPSSQ